MQTFVHYDIMQIGSLEAAFRAQYSGFGPLLVAGFRSGQPGGT